MKKKIIIQIMAISIAFAGCTGNEKQSKESANNETESIEHKHEHEEEASGKLILHDGAKWQANAETTEGIKNMQSLVNNYISNSDTDNKKLSENLENEFTTIFQKCTMTGEAHEQLHNFLLPLKERIENIKASNDLEAVKELQSYLNNYFTYFE